MGIHVVRTQGVLALYNGLSASLMRQVKQKSQRPFFQRSDTLNNSFMQLNQKTKQ